MIVQNDFLNKIKDFGLNSYEAKLWIALLSRGISTAGELSDIANVPRSRSYDVLESLEKKGFIIMKLGKPINYIAVQPSEVLQRLQNKIEENAKKSTETLENLKDSKLLIELSQLHNKGIEHVEPADLTGAVKGRTNLTDHLTALIKNAKKSVLIATTQKGLIRKTEDLKNALKKANQKGIKVQILAKTNSKFQINKDVTASVRLTNELNTRFCVIDSKHLLLMPLDDATIHPDNDFAIWTNTEFAAKTFETVFNKFWSSAKIV